MHTYKYDSEGLYERRRSVHRGGSWDKKERATDKHGLLIIIKIPSRTHV